VDGIVLIAAGGHTQGKRFASHYSSAVSTARSLIKDGKAAETVEFTDLNTGNRQRKLKAPAQSVADYFDPDGPFNTEQSAARIKTGTAVMIIVPSKETENLKRIAHLIRDKLPAGTRASLVELEADHMNAPEQAKAAIRDWLLAQ
jgi:hypothetical protein